MARESSFGGLLKLALIGGGLYLLVRNTTLPAGLLFGGAPSEASPDPAAPQTSSTAPQPSMSAPTPNQPTPATAPAPATDNDAIARQAAGGNADAVRLADQRGIKYNADQWNWLRAAGGGGYTTADLFPAGDRGYVMLASEYLGRRQAAGLSGLGKGWRRS